MPNFAIFDNTTDKGKTSLGKYTLPKMDAFATNVEDVLDKQVEK